MSKKENTVKYGLENVHYAGLDYDSETKTYTYATPKSIPGAVSLSLSAQGSVGPFYADNIEYFMTETNNGYSGNAEFARIPKSFREDILLEVNGLEKADVQTKEFALLFEFAGDATKTRHVLYRCKTTRPDVASETTTNSKTPKTETLNITASQRKNDKYVKGYVEEDGALYETFYDKVYEPSEIAAGKATE
jgi:phi13 family phage major tail protein